jgi:aminomethyltransferase
MQQHQFSGPDVVKFLHRLIPSDLEALPEYRSTLSVLLNKEGGIVDDLMITKFTPKDFYMVTNATRRAEDLYYFASQMHEQEVLVQHSLLDDQGLIALQGPVAAQVLQSLTTHDLSSLKFGWSVSLTLLDIPDVLVSRGGYTGEDGFEISIPGKKGAVVITKALLESEDVKLAGLAARDALRLEAGLCLYGHDLDENTTPVESNLSWLLRKTRTGYLGYDQIKEQKENPSQTKRRVGFIVEGAPARGHSLKVG